MVLTLNVPTELVLLAEKKGLNLPFFLIEALREKVKPLETKQSLAEAYALSAQENAPLNQEFEPIDLHGWPEY